MIKIISTGEAYSLYCTEKDNRSFVVLDIRTLEEYKKGHIKGAVQIDYYSDDFEKEIEKLDRKKIYLVYCRTASRTSAVKDLFEKLGFEDVYIMDQGIIGWQMKGYPIE